MNFFLIDKNPHMHILQVVVVFFFFYVTRGGKISPNTFVHPNPPTLIEPKPNQLLFGLNVHPN